MKKQSAKKWLSFILCIALLLSWLPGMGATVHAQAASSFQIHFIDVGQADAMLIQCDGQYMLVDGGNAADSQIMYTYLQKMNVDHLNYVIGTHAHEDHIGGIPGALQYVKSIGTAYCPVTTFTTTAFTNFAQAVENHGKSITVPTVGTTFTLGSAQCKIIAVNTPSDDVNDSSIVMRITYGNNSFMLAGDAELPVETLLLNGNETLKSDVLKVGHHGSSSSTSYLWLREVDPDYGVICVGKDNDYGHPTETVLSRLRDADVTTYRTDIHGDIICNSDGNNITFTVSSNADDNGLGDIGNNSTVAPTDPKQIVDEAYSLADNASLPYTATLTGTVTKIDTPFSAENNNTITVTMTIEGRENYPIMCYKMSGPGADEIKIGSIIKVVGILKKYVYSSGVKVVEFSSPSLIEHQPESSEAVSSTAATAVKVNTPYKMALDIKGTTYYFTGSTSTASYYLDSSTDSKNAVTVYLEGTSDSYHLYFYNGDVKTYIRLYERTAGAANAGKPSLQLTTSIPEETYHFDTGLKTLVYTKDANNSYYMGTYNNYTNFSSSNLSYVSGSNAANVDKSQFPARLYEVETADNTAAQWNVTLKENIGVTFLMKFTKEILSDPDAWVSVTFCGEETKIPVSEAVNGIHLDMAAAQMTEEISICTVSGSGIRLKTKTYSVRMYADQILADTYDESVKTLVKEMLNYGAMAQLYFDYNTQNLANTGISGTANLQLPEDIAEYTTSGSANGICFYGASFVFKDKIGVRYYFTGDVTGCTFTVDGSTYVPVAKDGMHYIEIGNIMPQHLAENITLTVTDATGNNLSVTYGPLNYMVRMYQKGGENLQNLLKALYNYHLCAKAYTQSN